MKEMISRDAVLTILNHNWGKPKGYSQSVNEISELPIIQPKYGKWEPYSQFYPEINTYWIKWECSECGYGRTKGWEGTTDGRCPTAKICENCGAIMERGEANG